MRAPASSDHARRPAAMAWLQRAAADPRHFQILALSTLLAYGAGVLGFSMSPAQVGVTLGAALGSQWLFTRTLAGGAFDGRSALISGLSLCLLLRVDDLALAGVAAVLAMASKFALRVRARHLFNPTALAISVVVLLGDGAWVSPGQWGHAVFAALLFSGLGLMVLTRARRLDIALAFLSFWCAALLVRAAWYHDPIAIVGHQLGNGALLLFAFFMLTDPRTTPATRHARVLFALAVATTGAAIGFGLYRADGPILALALCAPLVPLLDALFTPGAPAVARVSVPTSAWRV